MAVQETLTYNRHTLVTELAESGAGRSDPEHCRPTSRVPLLSRDSHVRMEAKRYSLDESATTPARGRREAQGGSRTAAAARGRSFSFSGGSLIANAQRDPPEVLHGAYSGTGEPEVPSTGPQELAPAERAAEPIRGPQGNLENSDRGQRRDAQPRGRPGQSTAFARYEWSDPPRSADSPERQDVPKFDVLPRGNAREIPHKTATECDQQG